MDEDSADPGDCTRWFLGLPTVAMVEMDRYCEGCGYNLRTQPVRRDDRTQVPLIRCPECGRFHAAGDAATALRPWLQRLGALGLWAWILFLLWLGGLLLFVSAIVSYATLDDLTTFRHVPGGDYELVVRALRPADLWFIAIMYGLSACIAFLGTCVAVVACHHWRRFGYIALGLLAPMIPAIIVWLIWQEDEPKLLGWGTWVIGAHLGTQWAAALIGVYAGRPLARLLVRVLLPARARAALAFLWLADGRPPPAVR